MPPRSASRVVSAKRTRPGVRKPRLIWARKRHHLRLGVGKAGLGSRGAQLANSLAKHPPRCATPTAETTEPASRADFRDGSDGTRTRVLPLRLRRPLHRRFNGDRVVANGSISCPASRPVDPRSARKQARVRHRRGRPRLVRSGRLRLPAGYARIHMYTEPSTRRSGPNTATMLRSSRPSRRTRPGVRDDDSPTSR